MINLPQEKILFLDIETVGISSTYENLLTENSKLGACLHIMNHGSKKGFPKMKK